ncbi:hypothetical protein KSP40_PGU000569 [Platanthera guangdongensis]|uniref:CID domain-containing protein n=1 Tax=Platanthera guangdongensis TaxID=2320717 RepID=A0ABR2M1C1_9ASPA
MVPFLYLANDIIQNSRRKGSEFVNEFWKVLPRSLKGAYENGEENIKNSVMRLALSVRSLAVGPLDNAQFPPMR